MEMRRDLRRPFPPPFSNGGQSPYNLSLHDCFTSARAAL